MTKQLSHLAMNIIRAYKATANDYFYRFGGGGRYEGYQDWHPLALTISLALEERLYLDNGTQLTCRNILPVELVSECDNLAEKVREQLKRLNAGYSDDELYLGKV